MVVFIVLTDGLKGDVVSSFVVAFLKLLRQFCSFEQLHSYNFGGGYFGEHLLEYVLLA